MGGIPRGVWPTACGVPTACTSSYHHGWRRRFCAARGHVGGEKGRNSRKSPARRGVKPHPFGTWLAESIVPKGAFSACPHPGAPCPYICQQGFLKPPRATYHNKSVTTKTPEKHKHFSVLQYDKNNMSFVFISIVFFSLDRIIDSTGKSFQHSALLRIILRESHTKSRRKVPLMSLIHFRRSLHLTLFIL